MRDPSQRTVQLQSRHTIRCHDGYELAATLFLPDTAKTTWKQPTVIASATAVDQKFYARFAGFLAANARPTLTFDYRGTGGSAPRELRGSPIRYRDWGIRDVPAVLDWTSQQFETSDIHWIGHSYGGFATGLAHNNTLVTRQLSIAAMSADVRFVVRTSAQLNIGLQLLVLAPLVAHTIGYVPAAMTGGVALPKHVALEWARWVRSPNFLFSEKDLPEITNFSNFNAPIQFAYALDDPWVSAHGVEKLSEQFSGSPQRSTWGITAAEAGPKTVGHMGFFRSEFTTTLWPKALQWLDTP